MGARSTLGRVPWRFVLPVVTTAATAVLLYLNGLWMIGAGYWDDLPVTTAWGLARALNGPAYFLFLPLPIPAVHIFGVTSWESNVLPRVALFWAFLGWLAERRLRGIRAPLVRLRWLRGTLYAMGLGLALLFFLYGSILEVHRDWLVWLRLQELLNSPKRHLLGREVIEIGGALWGAVYVIYFGEKLLGWRGDRVRGVVE